MEDELRTNWISDVIPKCHQHKTPMEPAAEQIEMEDGPVWTMLWRCSVCGCIKDVHVPPVWATAYCMATNPLMRLLAPRSDDA